MVFKTETFWQISESSKFIGNSPRRIVEMNSAFFFTILEESNIRNAPPPYPRLSPASSSANVSIISIFIAFLKLWLVKKCDVCI